MNYTQLLYRLFFYSENFPFRIWVIEALHNVLTPVAFISILNFTKNPSTSVLFRNPFTQVRQVEGKLHSANSFWPVIVMFSKAYTLIMLAWILFSTSTISSFTGCDSKIFKLVYQNKYPSHVMFNI